MMSNQAIVQKQIVMLKSFVLAYRRDAVAPLSFIKSPRFRSSNETCVLLNDNSLIAPRKNASINMFFCWSVPAKKILRLHENL